MKRVMLTTLSFVFLTTFVCLAQEPAKDNPKETTTPEKQAQKATPIKTLTGCLQKGHEVGDFSITAEDGKTWDLSSTTVKLGEHVGHQVTVTGSAHRESKTAEKTEEKKEGQVENAAGKEEYGDLLVTDVKMVSETCTK